MVPVREVYAGGSGSRPRQSTTSQTAPPKALAIMRRSCSDSCIEDLNASRSGIEIRPEITSNDAEPSPSKAFAGGRPSRNLEEPLRDCEISLEQEWTQQTCGENTAMHPDPDPHYANDPTVMQCTSSQSNHRSATSQPMARDRAMRRAECRSGSGHDRMASGYNHHGHSLDASRGYFEGGSCDGLASFREDFHDPIFHPLSHLHDGGETAGIGAQIPLQSSSTRAPVVGDRPPGYPPRQCHARHSVQNCDMAWAPYYTAAHLAAVAPYQAQRGQLDEGQQLGGQPSYQQHHESASHSHRSALPLHSHAQSSTSAHLAPLAEMAQTRGAAIYSHGAIVAPSFSPQGVYRQHIDVHPCHRRLHQQTVQQQYDQAYAKSAGPGQPRSKNYYTFRDDELHGSLPLNETQDFYRSSSAPPQVATSAPNNDHGRKNPRRVSFSHLQIRTYETILGDNPSCSSGPPLSLGWKYDPSHCTASIDEYEAHQAHLYGVAPDGTPRRSCPVDLVLYRWEREDFLLKAGYTRQELAERVRISNKTKLKRNQTVNNLQVAFIEEGVETVRRTLRRWVLKKDRTRHMYDKWKKHGEGSCESNQQKKRG